MQNMLNYYTNMSAQPRNNSPDAGENFSRILKNDNGEKLLNQRILNLIAFNQNCEREIEQLKMNQATTMQKIAHFETQISFLKNQNKKLIELSSGNSAEILEVLYKTKDRVTALERLQLRR